MSRFSVEHCSLQWVRQSVGLWNAVVTTTLAMTGVNYYVIGTCP